MALNGFIIRSFGEGISDNGIPVRQRGEDCGETEEGDDNDGIK